MQTGSIELPGGFLDAEGAVAVLRFGSDGILLAATHSAARLFGYESVARLLEAAEHGRVRQFGPADTRAWVQQILDRGEVVIAERQLYRRNGLPFQCRIIAAPWYLSGRAAGVQAVLEDRGSRERLDSFIGVVLDSVPNPVFVKDSAHRWIALNEAYCQLMTCRPEDLIGKSDFDLHPPAEARLYWERDDLVFATGVTDENEEPWTDRSGRVHIIITRKKRHIVDDQPILVGVITDITERKRMEEALLRSSEELERRVAERTAELKRANDELREMHRNSTQFISMLSHELRNPLSPISNSLYVIKASPALDEREHRAVSIIERQVHHLTRLVGDLLDVTRVAYGKTQLKRAQMDLGEVVRRTLEDHRAVLSGRELVQDFPEEPVVIFGDATRLTQVLGNLLDNAAKFTPKGGQVRVRLREQDRWATLEVSDTGIGIDPETLSRLFQPFAQADHSLDRSYGGLGLGLALVKGLVELHGGEVQAFSAGPDQGSRFVVRLPCDEPTEQAELAEPSRAP